MVDMIIPEDKVDLIKAAEAEINRHRVCLLDASFSSRDEIAGRDLARIPHPLVSDTLERFAHLASGRRLILTHLNHSNPAAEPESPQAAAVRAAGFEVAEDFIYARLVELQDLAPAASAPGTADGPQADDPA